MADDESVDALEARIAELEEQNRALRNEAGRVPAASRPRTGRRWRSVIAVMAIVLGMVLAPIATVGTWTRAQLVDTDRFVQTMAPLAENPEVQSYIASQVAQAIEDSVDIDQLVADLVDGVGRLGLPPRAQQALGLLQGPAAQGVRDLIDTAVARVVSSEQFARLWEVSLRESHSRATAVLRGDPNSAFRLADDGTLSLQLDTVIRQVKQILLEQGFGFAAHIPEIEREIPLVSAEALVQARVFYQVSEVAGYWLPWIVLGLLAVGIAVAVDRTRALAWAGLGLTASFLTLAAGLGIAHRYFVTTVSPGIMPRGTADVLFAQITDRLSGGIYALALLSAIVAAGAWLHGSSRAAVAVRTAGDRAFGRIRAAADGNGLGTGRFGRAVDRWHSIIVATTVAIGVMVVFASRPASIGSVLGTLAVVLLVMLAVELVRRPAPAK